MTLIAQEREADAATVFGEAVRVAPRNPDARLNHGHALAALGRFDEATRAYRAGLALAPGSVPLLNALGLVFAAQGRRGDALAQFQESFGIEPGNEDTRADYAEALRLLDVR